MFLLVLWGEKVESLLQYTRADFSLEAHWFTWAQFLSCHFVHLNWWHYVLNAMVLAMFPLLFELSQRAIIVLVFFLSPCVAGGIHFFSESVSSYVGFSGVLTGLLVCAFMQMFYVEHQNKQKMGKWVWCLALFFLLGKIVREQMEGYDRFYLQEQIGGQVVVDAHLYGFLGGVVFALIFIGFNFMGFNFMGLTLTGLKYKTPAK